jgi:hypothetical protein
MRHTLLPVIVASLCLTAFPLTSHAQSHQRGQYTVEVLMNGGAQPVYARDGQSYIAGAYGSAYQIRVTNNSGGRIEAVIAVDGRDVVSGQPVAPRRQRGYIVPAYGSTVIDGFRSSTANVAAFRFASVPESYAWRTGTSWDIGTIRVWIFEEEAPPVVYYPPAMPWGGAAPSARSAAPGAQMDSAGEAAPQTMGTAYGEQRWSPVSYTSFQRSSRRADTVLGLRYNSWDMLAAAGIVTPAPVYPTYPVCYGYYCPGPFAPPPPGYTPYR